MENTVKDGKSNKVANPRVGTAYDVKQFTAAAKRLTETDLVTEDTKIYLEGVVKSVREKYLG